MEIEEQILYMELSNRLANVDLLFLKQVPDYSCSDSWGLFATYKDERLLFYKEIFYEKPEYVKRIIRELNNYLENKDKITTELIKEIKDLLKILCELSTY